MDVRVLLLTNEYPPHIYGGAGVHVEFLARELATLTPVEVRTFGTEDEGQGQIRVRGWIEERGGPWIEVTRAEQIEFADRE